MKKSAMRRNLLRSIKNSLGRYIAIAMIIALGSGIFVGLRMTKSDMVATGQEFMDRQNMFDLRLVSSYGWAREQVDAVKAIEGLSDVEGIFYTDLIVNVDNQDSDQVYRFYTIPEQVDRLVLLSGRMPENAGECVIDGYANGEDMIGKQVLIQENNSEETLEDVSVRSMTIVGRIRSPLYMDMNRGTTSVGNGSITDCLYVLPDTFLADYFTEIHVTVPGDYKIYTDPYNTAMEDKADELLPIMEELAEERLVTLRADSEEEYRDGEEEFWEGVREYTDGYHEAHEELREAYYDLLDAEQEIADREQDLIDGEEKIEDAYTTIQEGKITLQSSKKTLAETKASAYKQLSDANAQLLDQLQSSTEDMEAVSTELALVNSELATVNTRITEIESSASIWDTEISNIEAQISNEQAMIDLAKTLLALEQSKVPEDQDLQAIQEYEAEIADRTQTISDLEAEKTQVEAERSAYLNSNSDELTSLYTRRAELEARQVALEAQQTTMTETIATIAAGMLALSTQQNQMEAQFASADAQISAAEAQLTSAEIQLETQKKTIEDGWTALEEGKQELADGWKEYKEGLQEARQELADGREELDEAKQKLADARQTIDDMTENSVHILSRTSNMGYGNLDSSSDIVAGVSRVFPIFFLLVAALVCITTMTRMVDEERTQIGTLKALGYSNAAIISKYMLYAGSGAVLGCGFGVLMGSIVFPTLLWEAYKIMLFINDTITLTFDFGLCFLVVAMYTGVELLVTWYCCRRTLKEVSAELIRPKAPAFGKPLIFERMKLWSKVSFLNKVTIRNIFRYRQRLAMMLVGIGGCTGLLLTGFGLRDSIVNIVDFQFQDVTTYDMSVYFDGGQTHAQQESFRKELAPYASDLLFYHQISVEIQTEDQVREIYLIAADESVGDFIDFHSGQKALQYPPEGEMLLSSGVADALNIRPGDIVTVRDPDMQTMELKVSGVYDNYVYNYMIVSPQTLRDNWGSEPELQMAMVQVLEGVDVHETSAEIIAMDNVMNVTISEDLAFMVRNMMDALDLVVWIIVFCAALLAATVLYNLTNININERIREIATIKVLGFRAMETGMYIFKENLILSIMGTGFGLFLGKWLLDFVMTQIKINMVWFEARALPVSYVLSVVMTIFMALIVDFVFYFKLQRINMAEALKSVE